MYSVVSEILACKYASLCWIQYFSERRINRELNMNKHCHRWENKPKTKKQRKQFPQTNKNKQNKNKHPHLKNRKKGRCPCVWAVLTTCQCYNKMILHPIKVALGASLFTEYFLRFLKRWSQCRLCNSWPQARGFIYIYFMSLVWQWSYSLPSMIEATVLSGKKISPVTVRGRLKLSRQGKWNGHWCINHVNILFSSLWGK